MRCAPSPLDAAITVVRVSKSAENRPSRPGTGLAEAWDMSPLDTSPSQPNHSATTTAPLPRAADEARGRTAFRVRTGLRAGDCYMHYPPGSNTRNYQR